MTTRSVRTLDVPADIEDVWAFISDQDERANAISVVERYEHDPNDDRVVTWYLSLPIPFVSATVGVDTVELEREAPTFVRFKGESAVLDVEGQHELTETDTGTRLRSTFIVDGHMPGVESFFTRNLDRELDNLERALMDSLELEA